jgi:hypothetical protein
MDESIPMHNFQHGMLSAGDLKRRLSEMFPVLAGALKQICVLEGSILKGIHGETVI